jgi:hypothetical protein
MIPAEVDKVHRILLSVVDIFCSSDFSARAQQNFSSFGLIRWSDYSGKEGLLGRGLCRLPRELWAIPHYYH